MKIRLLRKLLNTTELDISSITDIFNRGGCVLSIGKKNTDGLITLHKDDLVLRYSLIDRMEGRDYLESICDKELLYVWDRLQDLIESGGIQDILYGKDEIDNPLPVFMYSNGGLIDGFTDFYGYPNIDDDGYCMWERTHFQTKKDAIDFYFKECTQLLKDEIVKIKNIQQELKRSKNFKRIFEAHISKLNNLKINNVS
jgi:hypothetical protein